MERYHILGIRVLAEPVSLTGLGIIGILGTCLGKVVLEIGPGLSISQEDSKLNLEQAGLKSLMMFGFHQ